MLISRLFKHPIGESMAIVDVVDVENAQQAWGKGIVAISSEYNLGGNYAKLARNHVEDLYAYDIGPVLFKPTFAIKDQFRPTFEGALSYFIGGNEDFPEDNGFAIKGWTKVRFENQEMVINGSTALSMGNYFFSTPEGEEVKVEFTFGYIADASGTLRIHLHHSSMPARID